MGFFDRIFGKKEELPEEELSIRLEDAEKFAHDALKSEFSPLLKSAKVAYEKVQSSAASLKDSVRALSNAPYSGRNEPIVIRKAVGSRKTFVGKMQDVAKAAQKPVGDDLGEMLDFHNFLAMKLEETDQKTVKEYAFLKELFEKDAEKVISSFKSLVESDKKLGEVLSKYSKASVSISKVRELLSELSSIDNSLKIFESGDLERRVENARRAKSVLEKNLQSFMKSGEWKEFLEMKSSVERIRDRMDGCRSDFAVLVSKIQAPLKKYNWVRKSRAIEDYTRGDFDSVLQNDADGSSLASALSELKKMASKGDIEVSQKSMESLNSAVVEGSVAEIMSRYTSLLQEIADINKKVERDGAEKTKAGIESEISRAERDVKEAESDMSAGRSKAEKLKKERENKFEELEKLLSSMSGRKLSLH